MDRRMDEMPSKNTRYDKCKYVYHRIIDDMCVCEYGRLIDFLAQTMADMMVK